ncbi:MAG: hypothetical protein FWG87_05590 [Defluviitaleaceae bacterium]|nr:hypothetical protein [Defluviitaleaceae bacterium]
MDIFTAQPRYNTETENAIQETKDMLSGKIRGKVYGNLSDFYNDLESEDGYAVSDKQTAWNNFKHMVKESTHENHLLEGDIFTRQNGLGVPK